MRSSPSTARNIAAHAVRGQYAGRNGAAGYLEDIGANASTTETFVALKVNIANWRWSGTPFYVRTGKRLRSRLSEIAVIFKDVPHSIFPEAAGMVHQNALVMRLQPHEGITLLMTIKDPGPGGMRLIEAPLDMTFAGSLGIKGLRMPDAYERLVMDVIRGDQTLFMRGDEVEAAWAWIDPILAAWEAGHRSPQLYRRRQLRPGGCAAPHAYGRPPLARTRGLSHARRTAARLDGREEATMALRSELEQVTARIRSAAGRCARTIWAAWRARMTRVRTERRCLAETSRM